MILTDEEKRMRDGAEGAATAAAMNLLIRYGDALACDRLCDVRNVAGTMTQQRLVRNHHTADRVRHSSVRASGRTLPRALRAASTARGPGADR